MISGFSFTHNCIEGGYPFVEAIKTVQGFVDEIVVVDMQSDDGTREVLEKLGVRIVDGVWEPNCLTKNHALHTECKGDVIVHFEADEVYSHTLIRKIHYMLQECKTLSLSVWRIQCSQNFQRVRWYPHLVHRVFPKGAATKVGHTTNVQERSVVIPQCFGLLWDFTYIFRDNIVDRCDNNAFLHGGEPNYLFAPLHINEPLHLTRETLVDYLQEPHWRWTVSPFDLPNIMKKHIGKTQYKVEL